MLVTAKTVFKIGESKQQVICPPDQVYANDSFTYLFTDGGQLVEDEKQYALLMKLLISLGETKFTVMENFGATVTERADRFKVTIPTNSDFNVFDKAIREFEPPFGFFAHHFFVFGEKSNWGIYISEYPTINIIGCIPELVSKFQDLFNIKGNGYEQHKEFIEKEFALKEGLLEKFIANYKPLQSD